MEVTKNVILDLLPLYSANELSADTRALVEKYLETDPELAKVAKRLAEDKPDKIPVALSRDAEMEAYKRARRWRILYTLILAGVISVLVISVLVFFLSSS
jgi:anti-sigma factor RsiW